MKYIEELKTIGLTEEQSKVYMALLDGNFQRASPLISKTGIRRSMVYKTLTFLEKVGLVKKYEEIGKVALFSTEHPSKIGDIIDSKRQNISTAEKTLENIKGDLISKYNLLSGKPNIQFFEGFDGVEKVLNDSLFSQTEIYTYVDLESIEENFKELNEKYVEKRVKKGIKKKILVTNTAYSRKFFKKYHSDITEVRLIDSKKNPFKSAMEIYDNKISYITMSNIGLVGTIIEDEQIYKMHKFLFETLWEASIKV